MNHFGKLQRKILAALSDGKRHKCVELAALCSVDDTDISASIKRLRAKGLDITSGSGGYHLVSEVPASVLEPKKRDPRTQRGTELQRLRGQGFTQAEAKRILDDHAAVMARRAERAQQGQGVSA